MLLVSGAPNQGERVWRRLLKADPSVDLVHFTILRPPDKDDTTPLNELALIAFPVRELFQEKVDQFDLIILDGFENRGIRRIRPPAEPPREACVLPAQPQAQHDHAHSPAPDHPCPPAGHPSPRTVCGLGEPEP